MPPFLPIHLKRAVRRLPLLSLASLIASQILGAASAHAQTSHTWTGSPNGNFSDSANWSPTGTPGGNDIAEFQGAAETVTFSSGTTNGSNLWVNNGGVEWDIGTGNSLALSATQTIVLGSTSAGTSALSVSSGVVNSLGNIRVGAGVFPNPATVTSATNSISSLTVTGEGTELRYQGTFLSGGHGSASINVTGGGQLISTRTSAQGTLNPNGALQLSNAGSVSAPNSQLNVSGVGSVADLGGSNPSGYGFGLIVAGPGVAASSGPEVNVTDGGYLHTAGLRIGVSNGFFTVASKIRVDGEGSKLRFERSISAQTSDNASVLAYSAAATLTIQNKAVVEAANNLQIVGGAGGGTTGTGRDGTLEIIGSGSRYTAVGDNVALRNVTLGHASTPLQAATLRLAQGGTLDLSNGGAAENGLLTLATASSRIIGSGGTIRADVDNGGLLSLGESAGATGGLAIVGDYTAGAGALHLFDIGGTASSEYDYMTVSGSISLSGTAEISFVSGFTASLGESFTLISGNGVSGTFSDVALPMLGGGLSWEEDYSDGYRLSVIPEPSALLLGALGLIGAGLFHRGRLRSGGGGIKLK